MVKVITLKISLFVYAQKYIFNLGIPLNVLDHRLVEVGPILGGLCDNDSTHHSNHTAITTSTLTPPYTEHYRQRSALTLVFLTHVFWLWRPTNLTCEQICWSAQPQLTTCLFTKQEILARSQMVFCNPSFWRTSDLNLVWGNLLSYFTLFLWQN